MLRVVQWAHDAADRFSKVSLSYPADSKPPVLAFSDVIEPDHQGDAEPIFSATLQANLSTFASFLNFWQDVLERCPSDDIKASLLDHFDFLFLRPLLYVRPNTLNETHLMRNLDIRLWSNLQTMTVDPR